MTRDDIIRMARDSGIVTGENLKFSEGYRYRSVGAPRNVREDSLLAFAGLVATAARTELAKPVGQAPAWHDAPTEPGLWVNSINRRAMLLWKNELTAWSETGARWYGPIPEDKQS